MTDPDLRLTTTHAADEFEGTVLGVATPLFRWVGLALVIGLGVFAALFHVWELDFFDAAQWSGIPAVIVVAYLRLFQQGKPPAYTFELIDSLITRGHAKPPRHEPPDVPPYV